MSEPSWSAIPDTRAVGQGNPPGDMNESTDELGLAMALLSQLYTGTSATPVQNVANHNTNIYAAAAFLGTNLRAYVSGATYSPQSYGAKGDGVTADDAAIASAIAAIPVAGGILDLSGAPVAYAITRPIALSPGISVIGTFINNQDSATGANKTDITCLASFSGTACMADSSVLNQGASVSCTVSSGTGAAALFTGTNTYTAGLPVVLNPTTTTAPGNFIKGALYYVAASPAPTGSAFYLALSPGGTAIAYSSAGSGVTVGNSTPTSSLAISIRGVSLDMSVISSGTPDAIRLMTSRSNVEYCFIRGGANSGWAIHFADQNAGGFNITNVSNENAARFNWISSMAGGGILADGHINALSDGFVTYNLIELRSSALGDAYSNTLPGIELDNAADWQVIGNHVYRCSVDAIVIKKAFTSFICHNKVDNFGLTGAASTTYHGIWITGANGPATTVTDNEVDGDESHGAATTTYRYFEFDALNAATGAINSSGNSCRKAQQNPNVGTSTAMAANGTGAGGGLTLNDWGFTTNATGTATPPAMAPVITGAVSLLRGPLPAVTFLNPPNPTATASASPTQVMMGIGAMYTPVLTGRLRMRMSGTVVTNTGATTAQLSGRYAAATSFTYTATSASPCVFTASGSALSAGAPVMLTGGIAPTGFTNGTIYYVVSPSGTTFSLAATPGGAAINSTSTGSGTQTLAAAPANGATLTGTAFGQGTINIASAAAGVYNRPFACEHVVSGLTLGTTYYVDLGCATGTAADTAGPGALAVVIEEIN